MKIVSVDGNTLVGYQRKIGVFGNCWTAITDLSAKPMHVVNIGLESLQACGVPFPIECREIKGRLVVTDGRIPGEAFRERPCTAHADIEPFEIWMDSLLETK